MCTRTRAEELHHHSSDWRLLTTLRPAPRNLAGRGYCVRMRRPLPYVLVIASAIAIFLIVAMVTHPAWQDFVETNGANIPTTNRILDYAAGIGWALLLTLFILVWPVPWRHKVMLIPAWLLRCLVALVVMLPYEARYSILDCW